MSLEITEILYDALRSPYGLVVETNDAELFRQRAYKIRKDSPALASLSFIISPTNGLDIWIVNKGAANAKSE